MAAIDNSNLLINQYGKIFFSLNRKFHAQLRVTNHQEVHFRKHQAIILLSHNNCKHVKISKKKNHATE